MNTNKPESKPDTASDAEAAEHDPGKSRSPLAAIASMLARTVITLALIAGGAYAAWWFNASAGRVDSSLGERQEAARLVETVTANRADTPVRIRAMGTVTPAREAVIRPRVAGEIVEQTDSFVPGASFERDELLLRIDRSDYEQALVQRKSDLAQAQATLRIELGDQAVAKEELELLEVDIPEINRDLILRIPQVNQARAAVDAAEASVAAAELDLRRTEIRAPFDGHIVARNAALGDTVSAGDPIATLIGSNEYWIEIAVPLASLRWMRFADDADAEPSPAHITDRRAWGDHAHRRGRVARLIGRLEEGTRLARVLVAVEDPLANDAPTGTPRLILDAFVDVEITGRTVDNAVVIDRNLVRENDTVWIMNDEDRLETREVSVAFRGRRHAYVTAGINDGDRVIRTNLQAPIDGMLLRQEPDTTGGDNRPVAAADTDPTGG